jgi:hypothetical protein
MVSMRKASDIDKDMAELMEEFHFDGEYFNMDAEQFALWCGLCEEHNVITTNRYTGEQTITYSIPYYKTHIGNYKIKIN